VCTTQPPAASADCRCLLHQAAKAAGLVLDKKRDVDGIEQRHLVCFARGPDVQQHPTLVHQVNCVYRKRGGGSSMVAIVTVVVVVVVVVG
jgi:hypothetical protein